MLCPVCEGATQQLISHNGQPVQSCPQCEHRYVALDAMQEEHITVTYDTQYAAQGSIEKSTNCPICGDSSQKVFLSNGYWIQSCNRCTHRYVVPDKQEATHILETYNDNYFENGSAGYTNYFGEADILRASGRTYGELVKRYTTPGSVLDVGAAAGFILQGLQDAGWQGEGLEPNARMTAYARTKLGLTVHQGTLERFHTDKRFDLITMIQVVAHFFDLKKAFQTAASLTQPHGYWLIETWNRDSLTARIFGKYWHEYSPPSVLHWFSPEGICDLASQFGFQQVAQGRPKRKLSGNHAKSLLSYKLGNSRLSRSARTLLKLVPDNLTIPYPSEDLFWILLQRNS